MTCLRTRTSKMNKSRLLVQNGYRIFADYQYFGRYYVTLYVVGSGTSLIATRH